MLDRSFLGQKSLRLVTALALLAGIGRSVDAAAPPIRIMPLGDSLTQGIGEQVGYRYPLYYNLQSGGLNVDFVGSLNTTFNGTPDPSAYPNYNTTFDRDHEGHTGYRADEVPPFLGSTITAQSPDIALIHLGTNDLLQDTSNPSNSFAPALNGISGTIDALRAGNPNVKIALAQIVPFSPQGYPTAVNIPGLNAGIASLAASKNTAQSPVILVNQAKGFDPVAHTIDRIHTNPYGEQLMANKFNVAIHKLINPSQPAPTPFPAVANHSFEDGSAADGVYASVPAGKGWTYYRGTHTDLGIFNPDAGYYTNAGGNGTPVGGDGSLAGFLYVGNNAAAEEAPKFSQDTGAILSPDTAYTLTVALGNPLLTNPDGVTWGGYTLEILAGDTVIASEINDIVPTPGTFTDVSLSIAANSFSSSLYGEELTIRLGQTSLTNRSETDFDNVRFTSSLIPEPTSASLFGGLGFLAVARRWRKRS